MLVLLYETVFKFGQPINKVIIKMTTVRMEENRFYLIKTNGLLIMRYF